MAAAGSWFAALPFVDDARQDLIAWFELAVLGFDRVSSRPAALG